jgi:hypothetical protein
MTKREHDHIELSADLLEISAALDALAARDRAGGPADLEQRIHERTRGLIAASDVRPLVLTRRSGFRVFSAMRVAAAVALCSGAVAIWMSQVGPHSRVHQSTLEDDVDLMLALRNQDTVGDRIDMLFSDTAALRDSVNKPADPMNDGESL